MVVMLSVSVMAWYALIQNSRGTAMVLNIPRPDDYGMRASGTFVCPNHFASLLAMMTPLAIGIIACRGVGVPLKLFAGYAAVFSLPALYLTESRSGWIGLMAGVVVTSIALSFRKGWKRALMVMIIAPLLVVAAGAAVWYVSPKVQDRVAKALAGDVRTYLWQDTMAMIKDAPWLGHGLASYRYYYAQYRDKLPFTHDPEFAHNDYLHFVAEIGVIGLLLAALIPLLIVWRALPVTLLRNDDTGPPLMAGLLGIMAAVFSHAVFDFNLHIFGITHVLVLLLAALIAGTGGERLCRVVDVTPGRYRWIGAGVVGVFMVGVVVFTPMVVSYFHEVVAEARTKEGDWEGSEKNYRKAVAWQQDNWRARLGLAHLLRAQSFWMRNPAIRDPWIDEALELYASVERLNPVDHSVWYGQGSLYKMRGDQESALAKRLKAVERIPRHIFYLNSLGLQLREMRRDEEALEVFRRSQAAEPNDLAERNIALLSRRIRAARAAEGL